jgi:hypothetical protein
MMRQELALEKLSNVTAANATAWHTCAQVPSDKKEEEDFEDDPDCPPLE